MNISIARRLAALVIAAGAMTPAQAIIYTGSWDPAFGSAFPDLGWRGEVTVFVPDACLAQSGFVSNFNGCSSGTMKLVSASVDFYSLSQPANALLQETLSFDQPASGFPWVLGMQVQSGQLTGIFGAFDYLVPSTLAIAGAPTTSFGLGFLGNAAAMLYYNTAAHPSIGLSDLYTAQAGKPKAFITFKSVPEPGSVALTLAGLLALTAVVRRRRATPRG